MKPNFNDAKNRSNTPIKYEVLDDDNIKIVSNKKFFIRTYGCQMNIHDSENIKYNLITLGYKETDILDEADVVVLNTCAIRENAKDKLFGFLSRAKHLKEKYKSDLIICLAGCLMQVEGEINTLEEKHKYVDIVIGTHNLEDLPKFIISRENKQNINVYSNSDIVKENIKYERDSNVTAFVNIMYGCDNFCTYCIVPFARGKERSRRLTDIINEVKALKENGYKEVILLGQNVNSYNYENYKFSNLLEEVAKTNIDRIRFVTSNPWNFTDKGIEIIKKYSNVMPYVHLPMQSGSNNILKQMNRKNTVEEYKILFDKLKKIDNIAITTDIIVGFPGETEEDFKETLNLVEYCKFDGAFTFIYSPREGTVASLMEDNTKKEEKEKRLARLNEFVNKYSLINNKKLEDKIVSVLVMGISEKNKAIVYGYTDTMKLVNIDKAKDKIGEIINVKITKAKSFSLDGIYFDK